MLLEHAPHLPKARQPDAPPPSGHKIRVLCSGRPDPSTPPTTPICHPLPHAHRNPSCRRRPRIQQFSPGDWAGGPRTVSAHRVPQGNGAPRWRARRRPQPDPRRHAGWLGLFGALWRTAGGFQAGRSQGGGNPDAARSAQPRCVFGARAGDVGLSYRCDFGPRRGAPDLPGRGTNAGAILGAR